MIIRHRDKRKEWAKNLFLILVAVGIVAFFFNLDLVRKGESVFSRSTDRKLRFTGDFDRQDYSKAEIARLLKFINRNDKIVEKLTVECSTQDKYRKVTPSTQVLFDMHILIVDGGRISTPTRRAARKNLISAILTKLNKDMRAYKRLKKKGQEVDSLVNTM